MSGPRRARSLLRWLGSLGSLGLLGVALWSAHWTLTLRVANEPQYVVLALEHSAFVYSRLDRNMFDDARPGDERLVREPDWSFAGMIRHDVFSWRFPLWIVFAVFLLPTVWLWWRDHRRPKPGHCSKCGYDLTGNVSGVCPECGNSTARTGS